MDRNRDENLSKLRPGTSVLEVIQLLGEPDEAWASVLDAAEMMFIYEGTADRSILFYGSIAVQFFEGRLGGPNATPFNVRIDVVVSGDRIELQKRNYT